MESHDGADPIDSILHIGDLHFWTVTFNPFRLLNKRMLGNLNVLLKRRHEFPMEHGESLVDALAAAGPKTALFTGDFSSTSLDEEFARARRFVDAVRARGIAVHAIPGNHDVYTFESVRARRYERHFSEYVRDGGLPTRVALAGGTPLVLVPTVCPNAISSAGFISDDAVAKMAALIAECRSPVLVAGHYPVLAETRAYTLTKQRRLRNADALRRALGESGKMVLYLAGHVHRFSFVRDERFPNLSHLCSGAFFQTNEREHIRGDFSEVHVTREGFRVLRHTLGGGWTKEEKAAG